VAVLSKTLQEQEALAVVVLEACTRLQPMALLAPPILAAVAAVLVLVHQSAEQAVQD
jgi:hypothetical protein